MLITFTGAQSTGKSTLVTELKKNPLLANRFTFIESFTRKLQKEHGATVDKGTADMQRAMLREHIKCTELTDTILDRCLLDCTAYSRYFAAKGDIPADIVRESYRAILKYRDCYDIVFYLRPEFGIVPDGVRPTSLIYQEEMAKIFDKLIKYMHNVTLLTGSVEHRMNTIYETLRGKGIEC